MFIRNHEYHSSLCLVVTSIMRKKKLQHKVENVVDRQKKIKKNVWVCAPLISSKLRDSAPEKLKEILAHEKLKGKKLMQKIFKSP